MLIHVCYEKPGSTTLKTTTVEKSIAFTAQANFHLYSTTPEEITSTILQLESASPGLDRITSEIIKACSTQAINSVVPNHKPIF